MFDKAIRHTAPFIDFIRVFPRSMRRAAERRLGATLHFAPLERGRAEGGAPGAWPGAPERQQPRKRAVSHLERRGGRSGSRRPCVRSERRPLTLTPSRRRRAPKGLQRERFVSCAPKAPLPGAVAHWMPLTIAWNGICTCSRRPAHAVQDRAWRR